MSEITKRNPKAWAQKPKHGALNVGLLALSILVAFGIGETVVRVWIPQPMLPRYVTEAPYGVRMNMPNMSYWHTSPDYHVRFRTNSHGIRSNREIPYEKPPGVFRILGLGDSFTLGYEVDLQDTYLYQLEEDLHKEGATNAEVVNLAVSGFGTAEELITLVNEGFKYSPDLVLVGYFVNDIENNVTSNLYSLKGDSLVRESATYLPATEVRSILYSIPGYRCLAENSQLLNLFRNKISYMIVKGLFNKNRERESQTIRANGEFYAGRVDSSVQAYEATLTARLLDQIYLECEKRGVSLLVLNIPLALSSRQDIISNIPIEQMHYANKVIHADATPIVAPFHHKREIHWEKWHGHWRPWVNHLVGEVLADTVIKHFQRLDQTSGDSLLVTQQTYDARKEKTAPSKFRSSNQGFGVKTRTNRE
jgi:lysophospholipase L1-like esterase